MNFGAYLRKGTERLRFDIRYSLSDKNSRIRCGVAILDENRKYACPVSQRHGWLNCMVCCGDSAPGIGNFDADDKRRGSGTTGITIDLPELLVMCKEKGFADVKFINIIVFQEMENNSEIGTGEISIDVFDGIKELVRDAHLSFFEGNAFEAIELTCMGRTGPDGWMINFVPLEFKHHGWKDIYNRFA